MKSRNHPHETREAGLTWYLVPLGAAAVAGVLVLSYRPALLADAPQPDNAIATLSVAASAGRDPSIPAASTVFSDRTWEVSKHVEQF
jgi:hypothetical protein